MFIGNLRPIAASLTAASYDRCSADLFLQHAERSVQAVVAATVTLLLATHSGVVHARSIGDACVLLASAPAQSRSSKQQIADT
jgi:hypothetical protein